MPAHDDTPGPVRVKVYGLLRMTRRTYLTCQAVGLVLLAAVLVVWALTPRPAPGPDGRLPPGANVLDLVLKLTPWAALLVLAAEAVETMLVLRAFARAEAERRTRTGPAHPPTLTPHAEGIQPGPRT
jgi:hypothetical protein